jgi:hypothetical protein
MRRRLRAWLDSHFQPQARVELGLYGALMLGLLTLTVIGCTPKGGNGRSGGSTQVACNISERFAQHPVVAVISETLIQPGVFWVVRFVPAVEASPAQTPALADRIAYEHAQRLRVAAAVAGPGGGGTQSGGTNAAGGDTNVTVFCGKDADPIFTGPGGTTTKTTNKDSGNTTTEATP